MTTDTIPNLLKALAQLCQSEPRREAAATAEALLAGKPNLPLQPPCALDAGIRNLAAAPEALPEVQAILAAQDLIPWGVSPLGHLQTAKIGAVKAVATLMGPGAPIENDRLLFGLYYQSPNSYYPLHDHLADETYMILSGRALWTAGTETRWREAGEAIHHPSRMPHAFRTGDEGVLAIWRWSGDLSFDSYRLLPDPEA